MPIPYPRRGSTSASGAPPPTRTPSTDSYPSISSHAADSDSGSDSNSDASSTSSSDDRDSEAEEAALIQAEWEESMRQLEMVVSIVLVPFFGKWYGRKWAFWAYDRYLHVGLGRAFFGLH